MERNEHPGELTPAFDPSLGFTDQAEQDRLRLTLLDNLTDSIRGLGLCLGDARRFVAFSGYAKSIDIPKDILVRLIKESEFLIVALNRRVSQESRKPVLEYWARRKTGPVTKAHK